MALAAAGEAEVGQFRRLGPLDEFEEIHYRLRRVALAVGGDDKDHVLLGLELARLVVGKVGDGRVESALARRRREGASDSSAVPCLAAV